MGATIMHFVGVGTTQKASLNTQQVQLYYYFHFAKILYKLQKQKTIKLKSPHPDNMIDNKDELIQGRHGEVTATGALHDLLRRGRKERR